MRKIIFIVFMVTVTAFACSQNKTDFAGMWKVIIKAGNKNPAPTFIKLNTDGSYVWGFDADGNVLNNAVQGTWDLTSEGEIKIIPEDKTSDISYYVKKGDNSYKYEYTEKDGVKSMAYMLEMDQFIEKVKN